MVTPFLWFDNQAEEASRFYVSIFKNSKINSIMRGPDGKVTGTTFHIDGREFMTLNGGPLFKFTEAVSLYVNCESQKEVDELWEKLTSGGGEGGRCGWLKDKYGLSWQIIPDALPRMLNDPDPRKAKRVFDAMMKMSKLDIAALKKAHGESQ
jgi:predicted 3-demethylubiquinone-9 3-methyltransferase (glyoxalase superfamily)